MTWSIRDALSWLDSHQNYEARGRFDKKPSLSSVVIALDALGISSNEFLTIHVAGTNGKGSTCRIASELLVALGYKVGTFTSPHLHRLNERIQINGEPVSDELLADELLIVSGLETTLGVDLTWFEIVTITALSLFYAEGIECLVLEVGIGGTWDSTNVMHGDVAVITSLSQDHLELLGPTVQDIARNKAGIIKPGATALIGLVDNDSATIIGEALAAEMLWLERDIKITNVFNAVGGWKFDLVTKRSVYSDIYLSLHGRHQINNAALAIAATEELLQRSLSADSVLNILASIDIPGRGEVVLRSPLVILDVAHNADGAKVLAEMVKTEFSGCEPVIAVVSLLAEKDAKEFFRELSAVSTVIVLTTSTSDRSMPLEELKEVASQFGFVTQTSPTVESAVSLALNLAGDAGMVVVTGSFRLVGPARSFLLS